jgi:hypothetical protein
MENREQKASVGISILEGACNPKAIDLTVHLGEIGLDSLMDEGILKEIPVLKSIIACKKTWEAIHDKLFLRKVAGFIFACPEFSEAEREQFAKQHLNDANSAKRLGDGIVLILDKLDDLEKPQMVAKAFAALVRSKISLDEFRRLAAAIDIGFLDDLTLFSGRTQWTQDEMKDLFPKLVRTGLIDLKGPRLPGQGGMARISYEVSQLGVRFCECMKKE